MQDFKAKLAVVTGAGSGIGRQLAVQLAAQGCNLALCDLNMAGLEETRDACGSDIAVSLHQCDMGVESEVQAFAAEVLAEDNTESINLLFNNAGLAGGGSFVADDRAAWERTFNVCWEGVYFGCRAFLPLLIASDEGHLVNVSSVNGLWASLGSGVPHTSYSAAKFAVRGFTEALINDIALHAPHVGVSVVMPGHIGTNIVGNSQILQGSMPADMSAEECEDMRKVWTRIDPAAADLSDQQVRDMMEARAQLFTETAPTTAAEAASIILNGIRAGEWRILVGDDAVGLDALVREMPDKAYSPEFYQELQARGVFHTIT